MQKPLFSIILTMVTLITSAQIYVLKDHRDSIPEQELYDSLDVMADSFYQSLLMQNVRTIKNFVPTVEHLRHSFDTLDENYSIGAVETRKNLIQKKLERSYSKILKKAKKGKLTFKRYEVADKSFTTGRNENGNEYCYVTYTCNKKKKKMTISYLALKLDGYWFLADELKIYIQ